MAAQEGMMCDEDSDWSPGGGAVSAAAGDGLTGSARGRASPARLPQVFRANSRSSVRSHPEAAKPKDPLWSVRSQPEAAGGTNSGTPKAATR